MTKKYGDEAIIKKRREYQKLKYNSLDTGIFVKEQLISFREQEIDSLGTRMILPEVMEPMEEEMKKRKYPMEKRPAIIWSDPDGTVSITINFLSQGIESDALEQVRDDLGNTILSISPHYMFLDKGKVEGEERSFYWAEFLSPVLGGMVYNILYVAPWKKGILLGSFSCPSGDRSDWSEIMLKLMPTIREGKDI